ncbi:MAG: exodeoxyribonuclease III [Clostridiales bacterium]|nr:exodeoxyribonuclease III [Clostridiales bacterium]
MKILSWNVNGLRACVKKGFLEFYNKSGFDIFCVQETKMQPEQREFELEGCGYWNSALKKGYSGTAVFAKPEPLSVETGMGESWHDTEGRLIKLEYDKFILLNVYTPNAQHGLPRLPHRLEWEDAFRAFASGLDTRKPVIICGDLNVAHTEMDIKNARSNMKNPGFTQEERGKMTELLDAGFADTFRRLNPDRRDAYTWWSNMANARERNVGWRIDYFLVSERIMPDIKEAFICQDVYGSDHCPVGIVVDV